MYYKCSNILSNHTNIGFFSLFQSLKETILLCCEAFCKCLANDGYFLHVDVACKLYGFLAKLDCSLPTDNDGGHGRRTSVGRLNRFLSRFLYECVHIITHIDIAK